MSLHSFDLQYSILEHVEEVVGEGGGVDEPHDALDEADDAGDAGPEEHQVQDAVLGVAGVEVVDAEVAEEDGEDGANYVVVASLEVVVQLDHTVLSGEGEVLQLIEIEVFNLLQVGEVVANGGFLLVLQLVKIQLGLSHRHRAHRKDGHEC